MAKENRRKEKLIHIRLSSESHKTLKIRCAHEGTTIQEMVASLIEQELSPPPKESK